MEMISLDITLSSHRGRNKVEHEYRVLVPAFDLILASVISCVVQEEEYFSRFSFGYIRHLLVHHRKALQSTRHGMNTVGTVLALIVFVNLGIQKGLWKFLLEGQESPIFWTMFFLASRACLAI